MRADEQVEWYAVRCVFAVGIPPAIEGTTYEERITLWRASTAAKAVERAEVEAAEYAAAIEEPSSTFLGFCQSYRLFDVPADGAEIFSLMRDSDLGPAAYLSRFFDDGAEHQEHIETTIDSIAQPGQGMAGS